jgi:hypothetical protein
MGVSLPSHFEGQVLLSFLANRPPVYSGVDFEIFIARRLSSSGMPYVVVFSVEFLHSSLCLEWVSFSFPGCMAALEALPEFLSDPRERYSVIPAKAHRRYLKTAGPFGRHSRESGNPEDPNEH